MRLMFSVFMAGRSVNVLMAAQERNHKAERAAWVRRKEMPYAAGQKAARMNRAVRISR